MTQDRWRTSQDNQGPEAAAEDWVVRLHGAQAGEDDWLAFEQWLAAASGNRAAYDAAAALWRELDRDAPAILSLLEAETVAAPIPMPVRRAPPRAARWLPLAAAITLVILVGLAAGVLDWPGPAQATYATRKGETRLVQLQDGSRIMLNSGSRIRVQMGRRVRRVFMDQAEASFDVAKDASRPFVVAVGDQQVRVVGTEFNILHDHGAMTVTVRRGVVEVRPKLAATDTGPVRLTPGAQLVHREGVGGYQVRRTDPNDAFSWRQGVLVYHDRPLDQVARDLNRYFDAPVRVAPDAQRLTFSGVLAIDREDAMIKRLADFLPIAVRREARGYVLSARR